MVDSETVGDALIPCRCQCVFRFGVQDEAFDFIRQRLRCQPIQQNPRLMMFDNLLLRAQSIGNHCRLAVHRLA